MSVGRICIRDVDTVDREETVWQAAERMHQRAVGTLVIMDHTKEPIGIVTDRDLVERVLAKRLDADLTPVSEVMTTNPKTISEDAPIESALAMMRNGRFRRLPVVDAKGGLVGMLSFDDVLMLLAEEFRDIGQLLEQESPGGVAAESLT